MRYVTFDFDGSPLPLMLTAGALFDIYDRFGVHDSILRATGAMEDTPQGWMACCELAELLMQQAALWRRRQGYTDRKRTGWPLRARDRATVRTAVRQAIAGAFTGQCPPERTPGRST